MRSKYILGVLGAGVVAALVGGCGSDAETGTGGTGGTGATGSSSSSTGVGAATSSSTGTGTPTSSSSTGTPDTNIDCASGTAIEIDGDGLNEDEIQDADTDEDFFTFDATAGQALFLFVDAKPATDEFEDGYIDSVLTLFGPDGQQYALNDDPIPRNSQDSELYTVIPADGKYCIKVEHFCHFAPDDCAGAAPVTDGAFGVYVASLDPADESVIEHDETLDATTGTPMEYLKNPMSGIGQYYVSVAYGDFASASDPDSFIVNAPDDLPCDANGTPCAQTIAAGTQRINTNIDVFPVGTEGNGSTVPVGLVYLTTVEDTTTRIAQLDATKLDPVFGLTLTAPVDPALQYRLFVTSPAGAAIGANPFYVLVHTNGGSNPLEQETATENSTFATAETLEGVPLTTGYTGYFIAGDLADGDADYFKFDNATMAATDVLRAVCSGQRSGSGLRDLKFTIYEANESLDIADSTVETDEAEATIGAENEGVVVSPNEPTFTIKIEAGPGDVAVSGRFYQCGISFGEPSMQ